MTQHSHTSVHSSFPLCTALRKSLKHYNFNTFRDDVIAAFVVSLVALPLSMALAIAVGLPPQHGIYTAIVAGILVPLLGGSSMQVSGPTAAFVVILAPIVSELGLRGIIWCQILAGIILLLMGFARMGKLINYVPYPVTTGFTAGIALVLATLSLNDLLGLGITKFPNDFIDKVALIAENLSHVNIPAALVGGLTLLLILFSGKFVRVIPSSIIGIAAGAGLGLWCVDAGYPIDTIGSRFSFTAPDGTLQSGIPPYPPTLHWITFKAGQLFSVPSTAELKVMILPAFTIAILAALESLLSATVADSMARSKHDPNAELNAIGIGNIFSGLATGIPATGAIARTATNINNGARTPLASSMHGMMIVLYVILLAPYIRYIPMPSLAALLIVTAYRMSHVRQFMRTIRIAPDSDVFVLVTCFILTTFVDMVAGVTAGIVLASFLLMKRITELTHVEFDEGTHTHDGHQRAVPKNMMVYRIRGPLFFGTAEKAFDRYSFIQDHITSFVVDISHVPFIDMTGLVAFKSMLTSIASNKRTVYVLCDSNEMRSKIYRKMADQKERKYVKYIKDIDELLPRRKRKKR